MEVYDLMYDDDDDYDDDVDDVDDDDDVDDVVDAVDVDDVDLQNVLHATTLLLNINWSLGCHRA